MLFVKEHNKILHYDFVNSYYTVMIIPTVTSFPGAGDEMPPFLRTYFLHAYLTVIFP